jgi:hypothetical protein
MSNFLSVTGFPALAFSEGRNPPALESAHMIFMRLKFWQKLGKPHRTILGLFDAA